MVEEILYEIINEAKDGQVEIDSDIWPVAFNTIIVEGTNEKIIWNDNNNITLLIKNKKRLLELLDIYVELELEKNRKTITFFSNKKKNQVKFIITYLFVNATTEDFLSPIKLVEKQIKFLNDVTLDFLNNPIDIDMGEKFINSKLHVQKYINSVSMETTNRIDMSLLGNVDGKDYTYNLPSIYYEISDGTCYIYSVMMPKIRKETSTEKSKYDKKINRFLYQINDGVKELESHDYFDYKEGKNDYYPEENITDVTHSFLLAINIFIAILQAKKIDNLKVVAYLPVRYQSRDIAAQEQGEERRKELEERNNYIQQNITNKIIRTFRRLSLQNSNIIIKQLPYEEDEFLNIIIKRGNPIENEILKSTDLKIKIKTILKTYD